MKNANILLHSFFITDLSHISQQKIVVSSGSCISHLSVGFGLIWCSQSEYQFTQQMNFDNVHVSQEKVYVQSQDEVKVISQYISCYQLRKKGFQHWICFSGISLRRRISIAERKGRIVTFFLCIHCLESAYCLGLYVCGSAIHWWLNSTLSSFSCVLRLRFPICLSVVLIMRDSLGQYVLHFLRY